jgi:hypothetical protein
MLYLDDLHPGQRFTSGTYVMDETRIKESAAEFDPQPFHLDKTAAQESIFKGLARWPRPTDFATHADDAVRKRQETTVKNVPLGPTVKLRVARRGQIVLFGINRPDIQNRIDPETSEQLGKATPTEVIAAWKSGADFVKIFPCGSVGGVSHIRALKVALPHIEMVPTEASRSRMQPNF